MQRFMQEELDCMQTMNLIGAKSSPRELFVHLVDIYGFLRIGFCAIPL
jgi:hypothetical protein